MSTPFIKLLALIGACLLLSCQSEESLPSVDQERYFSGGETTIFADTPFSFDNPAPNLSSENLDIHLEGDAQFEAAFVTAPAPVNPGLGAQFNNTNCLACHPSDGRARMPEASEINGFNGFFLRVSIPGEDAHGGPNPAPGFGGQLQNHAIYGKVPEVKFQVTYEEIPVTFADGTSTSIRKPTYSVTDAYMELPAGYMLSPRIGPPVYGLGLLEAITEADLLQKEDISDSDQDGISGKANRVWDEVSQSHQIGRFGWKGGAPTVMVQSAAAYNNDMGITSPLFPVEADYLQTNGSPVIEEEPDITQEILEQVVFYCRTLAVPAARNLDDPQIIKGASLFNEAKCHSCHTPRHITGSFDGIPEISNQTIYPYTDLLLHDMGPELADGRPEFLADGNEWQTRPLWGIGLTQIVNGHTNFLHDGRARNIEEAVLWHGGEAAAAKNAYLQFSKEDREALLAFLNAI